MAKTSVKSYQNENFEANLMNDFIGSYDQVNILTLNDYILEHIYTNLTLPDKINVAVTCQRFSNVLAMHFKAKLINFDISIMEDLTLFQMNSFLQIVDPQTETLTADLSAVKADTEESVCLLLGKFLTNVKKLKLIENTSVKPHTLIEKMHLLQDLELYKAKFDDEFIEFLQSLKNLKILRVIKNSDITGCTIKKLTGLESLTLHFCPNILPHFKIICKNLTKLTCLDIRFAKYSNLDTEDYRYIAKYLVQLRSLKIPCKKGNYNCLAKLPKLQKLDISITTNDFEKIEKFFALLAKHQANQLEELNTNNLWLELEIITSIAKLKKLKVLKCVFTMDDEMLKHVGKLKRLETFEYVKTITSHDFLQLLEKCHKLKHISLWNIIDSQCNIITKSCELLEQQRKKGSRKVCVDLVLLKASFGNFGEKQEIHEFGNLLKIIEVKNLDDPDDDFSPEDSESSDEESDYSFNSVSEDENDFF